MIGRPDNTQTIITKAARGVLVGENFELMKASTDTATRVTGAMLTKGIMIDSVGDQTQREIRITIVAIKTLFAVRKTNCARPVMVGLRS